MPATNQRNQKMKGTPRPRRKKVKKSMSGTGHAPSSLTNRRQHTNAKKGDYGRQTSLYMSSADSGPFMQTAKGDGFPKRKRGKHRLRTKEGARRGGEIGIGGM